ncbi:MAG: protein kinase domain-containing protein [Phycisphaerae bacterium]
MSCPKPAELIQHAQGLLSDIESEPLDRHMLGCKSCLDVYVEAGKNPLIPAIPGYHIVKEVGRGRFGVVYKAWRTKDEPAMVALKILSDPGDMEISRFEREIAVLQRIQSPGIVRCVDSGSHGELFYLVMDFVKGKHLDAYVKEEAKTLEDKLRVFQKVCLAVAEAHEQGVIHRDIKPKNILVDDQGDPHVLDFGICMVEQADWSGWISSTITHAGDIVGTLKYMSPEQAWGGGIAGNVNARSDVWSLGVILYEIVTNGGYPYPDGKYRDRPKHEALLEQIRKDLPEQPNLEHLPRGHDLETLLERCLAWEPEFRLNSVDMLADDIGKYVEEEPIQTRPLWMLHRLRRLAVGAAAQSRWMFTMCFVAMLGVAVWGITFLFNVRWFTSADHPTVVGSVIDPAVVAQPREHVVVGGVYDESLPAVVEWAQNNGFSGVTEDLRTWRAVHAHLMDRLRVAKPRVVTFDYYFSSSRDEDDRLAEAINALEASGTPVVLASLEYDDQGTPDISDGLRAQVGQRLRHGSIAARQMVSRPGEFLLAIERPGHGWVPTLPVSTFAAALQPEGIPVLGWDMSTQVLEIGYEVSENRFLRPRDQVNVGRAFHQKLAGVGVRRDDMVLVSVFELERPEFWESRTHRYEDLLAASDQELERLVSGRVLILGDLRKEGLGLSADRHDVKYGMQILKDVPGCYLVADAIAGLFSGWQARPARMLQPVTLISMLILATAGCLVPIPLARHRWMDGRLPRRLLWILLGSTSFASLAVMFVSVSYPAVHLGMAGFSFFTPMMGSFWVEFARNRHRVLDDRRKAITDLEKISSGTATLGLKPG